MGFETCLAPLPTRNPTKNALGPGTILVLWHAPKSRCTTAAGHEQHLGEWTPCLSHNLNGVAEVLAVHLLEQSARKRGAEVDVATDLVDLDVGLGGRGKRALGALTRGADAAERALIVAEVLLVLGLELFEQVIHELVVEVLASEVRVPSRGFDLKQA